MKDKDFLEFLTTTEAPPTRLKEVVRQEIRLSFQGSSIFMKFIAFQILGALISLAFCPQFGLSFFVKGHGITHELKMIGDWACALFCGSLFLSTGSIIAIFSMKAEELAWVWSRKKLSLLVLPAFFWGILMLFNVSFDLQGETVAYHLVWIIAGVMFQSLWLKMRSVFFRTVSV